ncbi:MAG TPA: protein TolQ [Hypericibacter adhaerens]|jgi:biopolymer transport protein TolQ|uniref:Tol-Pal system protein TolQ n=1 Tax=Hypericibacter adhaerens TaxID=2602016 RepID=A0A5J6N1Z8_9PROT|nr:protein TolQ [Hypericibacter adhaerens]QEX23998.1 Tol-Pal system subunit TolQ [Hypericibacter adhaerens]HWA44726.1 protein TolQ [Hypericibacter adhaerens]
MENAAVDAANLAGSAPPADLTIIGLFMQADIIVKVVILILLLASFWTWAIIFDKVIRIRRLTGQADKFEESFWSGGSLEELFDRISNRPPDPMSAIFVAAMREWRRSAAKGLLGTDQLRTSLQDRIERVMDITLGREMEQLERHLIYLASVGSSAPFIGLFGTVWGIMNSFASIAAAKNTTLAVVAPGIAEALFATALGLVAAIPAVLAYNKLSGDISRYGHRLEAFSGEFGAILSRQLEEKR